MKRKMILFMLCISLTFLLVGCKGKKEDNTDNPAQSQEDVKEENTNKDDKKQEDETRGDSSQGGFQTLKLNKHWSELITADFKKEEFTIPDYEAMVKPYSIAKDLSNIENIDQFSGFTKEQKKRLSEDGFIVVPSSATRIHYVYDDNEYKGIPNFITADLMLHTYHHFYDKSLSAVELGFLYEDLELLTKQMLVQSINLWNVLEEEDLKQLQERNVTYYLIARMLIKDSSDILSDIPGEYSLPMEAMDMAKQEFALIQEAKGFTKSPYFDFDYDYTQFTVRGHYTRSEELGKYFKTVMWFGTAPLPLVEEDTFYYKNTLQSLLMTYTTFLDTGDGCAAENWMNIYQPTAQYVGLSDDIDVFTMNNLRKEVFGENENPNIFNDKEYYESLVAAVKALPEPKIQPALLYLDIPSGKQFRYMGQRYLLDSDIMQSLMKPILRPLPSSLDVMGALGSEVAEDLLFQEYKPQERWEEYEEIYMKQKKSVEDYSVNQWSKNLYNGWLWSVQESLTEFEPGSGMPFFMTTDPWKYKSLNTALGSYTELKHDTVLYGKQGVAEGGGPIEYADYHYVEPNIPLYSKLLYLTDQTVRVLEERGMMNESLEIAADNYTKLLELLIRCSVKELRNEMLTEEEYSELLRVGGTIEWIMISCQEAIPGMTMENRDLTDMLVTDVATNPGAYLSLATGYFDHIYVVVPVNNLLYLSRGSVYSHYEFVSDTRLTDETWWELQGMKIVHSDYADYFDYTEPSDQLPDQPFWVNRFKSDVNEVEITSLEVDWSNLEE